MLYYRWHNLRLEKEEVAVMLVITKAETEMALQLHLARFPF